MNHFEKSKEFFRAYQDLEFLRSYPDLFGSSGVLKSLYTFSYLIYPNLILNKSLSSHLKKIYNDASKPKKYSYEFLYDLFSIFNLINALVQLILLTLLFTTLILATLAIFFQDNKKKYALDLLTGMKNIFTAALRTCATAALIIIAAPIKIICIPFRAFSKQAPSTLEASPAFQVALKTLDEKEKVIAHQLDATISLNPEDTIEICAAIFTLRYKTKKALRYHQVSAYTSANVTNALQLLTGISTIDTELTPREYSRKFSDALKRTLDFDQAHQEYAAPIDVILNNCRQAVALFQLPPPATQVIKHLSPTP